MIKEVTDGWLEVDSNKFWILCKSGSWTGLTVVRLGSHFGNCKQSAYFHVHFYPQDSVDRDYAIGDLPIIDEAKPLAGDYYDKHVLSTAIKVN